MKTVLALLLGFSSIAAATAQDAKSLLGKWQVVSMSYPSGQVLNKADREMLLAEIMKESKNDAISIDSNFSEQDSLDALKEATYLIKGMYDAVQEYQAKGVFLYHGWNEKEAWSPVVLKGTYTYDPAKKLLTTTVNGKSNKNTVSKVGNNLKFSRPDKGYIVMEKMAEH